MIATPPAAKQFNIVKSRSHSGTFGPKRIHYEIKSLMPSSHDVLPPLLLLPGP